MDVGLGKTGNQNFHCFRQQILGDFRWKPKYGNARELSRIKKKRIGKVAVQRDQASFFRLIRFLRT